MFIVPMSGLPSVGAIEKSNKINQEVNVQQVGNVSVPFADVFKEAVENLKETQAISRQDSYDLAMGKVDDLHTVSINSAKEEIALDMTVQLTTRAVAAYNEVIRMQV